MSIEPCPYEVLTPTDLPWQETRPSHWQVRRIKSLFTEKSRNGFPQEPLLAATQTMGVVRKDRYATRTVTAEKGLHLLKLAEPGDFVISLRSFQGGIELCHDRGIISPAYTVLESNDPSIQGFASILFKSQPFIAGLKLFITGIRDGQNVNYSALSRSYLAVPPLDEQLAIVKYVRHIEREVGAAIRAKRQLVSFLNEQKLAAINHLITRGTRGAATPKKPAILGLPEIAGHWDSMRLKHAASHIVDCLHATPKYVASGGFPIIRTADIEPGRTLHENAHRISASEYYRWTYRLEPQAGDILYSREGGRFGIAAPVPPEVRLCIGQRMVAIRIKEGHSSEYMMWQLNCRHVFDQASADMVGSASPRVNVEQIKNYRIVAPPLKEQQEIVDEIDASCAKIDSAIRRTEREISLLREYQTRLTADVVTGKLDVRAAAAALPDVDPHDPARAAYDADEDELNADLDGDDAAEESM